ncbi:MAG TPA: hypothetical protein VHB48_07280 [Chitinophagaceae bacterium]|nr:hypothetical protein [Chitinophagaceae bacterium]
MYKLAVFIAAVCLLAACSKDNITPSPQGIHGLMPLSVGNLWYYTKKVHDSATGAVKATGMDTIAIVSQVSINDVVYYQQYQSSIYINAPSFFANIDSNTVQKIDSATKYTFFKKVNTNQGVDSWADTVTSRCKGKNELYAYAADTTIGSYSGCLKNEVSVNDCTGQTFEKWVYFLKPDLGLVRIEHYKVNSDKVTYYLDFEEDLSNYHLQ